MAHVRKPQLAHRGELKIDEVKIDEARICEVKIDEVRMVN